MNHKMLQYKFSHLITCLEVSKLPTVPWKFMGGLFKVQMV